MPSGHEPVTDLIGATPDNQILVSRIYDVPTLASWSKGNVTLLGDAAHAMTPNLGQGACFAIEDGWALGSAIANNPDPETAFQEFQAGRRSRAHILQLQSRVMGWVVQAEHEPVLKMRDWVTRNLPEPVIRAGAEGETPLQQTRGFRGIIIPALRFQRTLHPEHHFYPGVSSHRWAELERRLEPHLLRASFKFVQLP